LKAQGIPEYAYLTHFFRVSVPLKGLRVIQLLVEMILILAAGLDLDIFNTSYLTMYSKAKSQIYHLAVFILE
jgi:hypothetical protein